MDANARKTILAFLATCLPVAFLLLWTALKPPTDLSPAAQGCRMSWMSPSYILQPALNLSGTGRYRLWLYREVGWDGDDTPEGMPVLFIPGNAGSFKQVRSIASSASRQYWSQPFVRSGEFPQEARPLDFFALDTNEELSAWDAATLRAQASFANSAVGYILSLYAHQASPPREVMVIGHSMGGVVARIMLTAKPMPAISTVISLSAPHAFPPLPISRDLERLYSAQPIPPGVLFLSVCGGSQDIEFPAEMCSGWAGVPSNWTRWSSGIEGVWTGVGHREMVWCHQVRWRVARATLDMGALNTLGAKEAVVEKWFGDHAPALKVPASHPSISESSIQETYFTITRPQPGHVYNIPRRTDVQELRIAHPLSLDVQMESCQPSGSCRAAEIWHRQLLPHPPDGQPFPRPGEGVGEEEGVVHSRIKASEDTTLRILGGTGWVVGAFEESKPIMNLGHFWESLIFGIQLYVPRELSGATWTTIQLSNLPEHALLVYRVKLHVAEGCDKSIMPPLLSSSTPERLFHPHASVFPSRFTSHLSSAPFMPIHLRSLSLDLWGSGACRVEGVVVRLDILSSLGRTFGRYRVLLVAWSAGVVAILNLIAWRAWDSKAPFPTIPQTILRFIRQVLPGLGVVLFSASLLPLSEGWLLGTSGMIIFAPLAPMLLLVCTALVGISCISLWLLLQTLALPLKVLGIRTTPPARSTLRLRHYVSIGVFFVFIVFIVPPHFAFLVAFVIHLWTTARSLYMSRDLTANIQSDEQSSAAAHYAQSFHLLLLLFWLLPLTAPFAVVWVRTLASVGVSALFASAPDGLAVICVLVLVSIESASSGRIWERAKRPWHQWSTFSLLAALSSYSFLLGPRYTYGIYECVEAYLAVTLIRPSRREGSESARGIEARGPR